MLPARKADAGAIQSVGLAVADSGALTSGLHARHGDRAMRLRLWSEITREAAKKYAEGFLRALDPGEAFF
ncbi:hypothetical protein [Rhodoferax sp.]|uniref:hypothetical protein n=1 Tax=Rhodoferax sp. TaxID=50421 RepID=UPI0008B3EDBB|nr:hypothetical protein [Rhodoferax sp.]MDO8318211.1 hypothetical protein [Rhodoferax sp.]MDP2679986.1 hypothetical protein [Rhodoferax sp.]OGB60212.1 MAG: hypothetical protein A2503_15400 [Burkholderiales bacterium RIFOXYD12_FULL_59_19]OGB81134.1 MAG: hypothetical protein A2496_14325 [Burkholderiales bacterium RIFOXYC12_FULL_60_6]